MSGQPRFRRITARDMDAVFAVRTATWDNPDAERELTELGITPESVRELLRTTHRGWLCEVDGQAVGFTIGNRATGEVWVIAVLAEHEGRGIGRGLIERVEAWLFDEGWPMIWLTTYRDEAMRAVGFYRHLGWEDVRVEPRGDRFMQKRSADAVS